MFMMICEHVYIMVYNGVTSSNEDDGVQWRLMRGEKNGQRRGRRHCALLPYSVINPKFLKEIIFMSEKGNYNFYFKALLLHLT